MSSSRSRTPYIIDDLAVAAHQTAAGILWRWRTEIATLITLTAALAALSRLIAVPWRQLLSGACCSWSWRYRTRAGSSGAGCSVYWPATGCTGCSTTTAGCRPVPGGSAVLWIRPTKVGERAHVLCRAGICGQDFEENAAQIAAACYARDARATANNRWSHLVTIDIIRRDTLAASHTVPSPLPALRARHQQAATTAHHVPADTRP